MLSIFDLLSLILVGATWGCSNSFLRKGSAETAKGGTTSTRTTTQRRVTELQLKKNKQKWTSKWLQFLKEQLYQFRHVSVWLPYVVNQSGSILFYVTLSQTDISIAVPACNALSLIFSICTSWFVLREPVERPIITMIGATLVMVGVAVCVQASDPR